MKIWSKENLTGAGALIVSLMVANFLNFVFNAFLGRALSFEQFGAVVFYNTVLNLVAICFIALSSTINHRVAYLNGKYEAQAGTVFTRFVRKQSTKIAAVLMLLWIGLSWFIGNAFHIADITSVILFSPIFLFGSIVAINKGYLQGNLFFMSVGLIILTEAFIKLLSAAALVFLNLDHYVYLSIPISLFSSFAISAFLVLRKTRTHKGENQFRFPKRFYSAALLTGLSTAAFLSMDVIMAKFYLSPEAAGQYSLLSLIGSIVFFAGSILNGFMITFISHDAGEKTNPLKTFYLLLGGTIAITFFAVLFTGVFGEYTMPFLFGDKVAAVLPYLLLYTTAVGLFTISSSIISYHLARQHYSFSIAVLIVPILLFGAVFLNHENIQAITNSYLTVSIIGIVLIGLMHLLQRNGRFIFANLVDLIGLFMPFAKQADLRSGGKRVLVMNWRDTKHKFGGGAEVYIHELAKRWVEQGNQVTLFCGNDGSLPSNETIDGVRMVRRGGFYFVYPWAFIYYVTRFRGRFDIILDCQNGIPFFTPLYAKEKVYCLLFHVHQEVFFKYLPGPMAWFASILENRVMPYAYRKVKFITISESTKQDMEGLDLIGQGIEVIFPGVNLGNMRPGEKNQEPTVLYLGRLKAYKSVDVLIKAFAGITKKLNNAKLIIAGSGEEEDSLKELTTQLDLNSSVEFLGKVPEHQKVLLMQRAWVFVNPSMMEGWGITTIEANACGTPVVAADVPGLRDSVSNPHTGFLVPHGDAELLSERIQKLLEDQDLRKVMGQNAVEWATQYDWESSASKSRKILRLT